MTTRGRPRWSRRAALGALATAPWAAVRVAGGASPAVDALPARAAGAGVEARGSLPDAPAQRQADAAGGASARTGVAGPGAPRAAVARLLALDADAIDAAAVRDNLAHFPAPRIIALQGSVPLVTMRPFAEFLVAMGYPESRIRDPVDGGFSHSSHVDAAELAGTLAWHFEREGLVPMLIGHSQGGMVANRVLHELARRDGDPVRVFDPTSGSAQPRSSVIDPASGAERRVSELRVPFAAAIATGRLMRVLLGQWGALSTLREVPDSVEEFTGFFIEGDWFTATLGAPEGSDRYRATGTARVRNVVLPSRVSHIGVPLAAHLAADPAARDWIERFDPRQPPGPLPEAPGVDTSNALHAAYIWASVKRHWCLAAQRVVRAAQEARA